MRNLVPATLALSVTLFSLACNEEAGKSAGDTKPAASADAPKSTSSTVDLGETLATVDGIKVGSKEFEEMAARKQPAAGDTLSMEEKKEVLDRLVDEKLLYKAALAKGLDQDPKVQKVMVNTLLREEVYSSVRNSDFNDEELQAYYEAHKDEFVVPEKVQIKRILIKVDEDTDDAAAKAKATELHGQLKKDNDRFKELAAKNSEDPFRRRGGDVGFVAKTGKPGLDDAVVAKAFEMNVGQLSAPFKTDEGYNVILVANKRERVERTFQQMKGSVLRKVKNERLKELYESYVAKQREGASISVNEEKLSVVEVKATRRIGPGLMLDPKDNPAIKTVDGAVGLGDEE